MKDLSRVFLNVCLIFLLLSSCKSNPTYDTFTTLLPWARQFSQVQPGFEYILVSANGHQALMALGHRLTPVGGSEDKNALQEYWYTGTGEMLRLVDGRINQALGFTREIRSQTHSSPSWSEVLESNNELTWFRKIDLMPGYRYNIENNVSTYKIAFPRDSPEFVPSRAHWVADSVEGKSIDGSKWLYSQRFAIVDGKVYYSEQCIDKGLCVSIRKFGVVVPAK